jgi:hypothetical protein
MLFAWMKNEASAHSLRQSASFADGLSPAERAPGVPGRREFLPLYLLTRKNKQPKTQN